MKTKKEVSKKTTIVAKKKITGKSIAVKSSAKKTKTAVKKAAIKKAAPAKKVAAKKTVAKHKTLSAPKKNVEAKRVGKSKLSSLKRATYMAFSIVLGLLLGTFVQLFLELVYMKKMMSSNVELQTNYFLGIPSFLPAIAEPFFLLAGLGFGIWLGFWGWRFVYVERRHRTTRIA